MIAKANIQDITDPLNPVLLDDGAILQVAIKDNGEPGNHDTISISVWGKDGRLLFSSKWDGIKTVSQIINGGNLQVH